MGKHGNKYQGNLHSQKITKTSQDLYAFSRSVPLPVLARFDLRKRTRKLNCDNFQLIQR
jgi:hypothetical protein